MVIHIAQELETTGLFDWIVDNAIPVLLLAVAVIMLLIGGGSGNNAGVMRRVGGVFIALAVIGLAVTPGAGAAIGEWLSGLFVSEGE